MNKLKTFVKNYWITVVIIAGAVLAYKILTDQGLLDPFVFVSLESIGASFAEFWPVMLQNMLASFSLLFPSLLVGILIALAAGIIMGFYTKIRVTLNPIVYAVSVIPVILLSPIAIQLAPSFRAASFFMIVYNTIWPTLFATITGIQTIDKRYLDNAATLELKGLKKMVKVVLPVAMPSIISGAITSLRSSFIVLVFAEMYGTDFGMGYFIRRYSLMGVYSNVWSGFIFMVAVLVLVVQVFELIERRLLRWTME